MGQGRCAKRIGIVRACLQALRVPLFFIGKSLRCEYEFTYFLYILVAL